MTYIWYAKCAPPSRHVRGYAFVGWRPHSSFSYISIWEAFYW